VASRNETAARQGSYLVVGNHIAIADSIADEIESLADVVAAAVSMRGRCVLALRDGGRPPQGIDAWVPGRRASNSSTNSLPLY
jgi:hypothetical protein